GEQRLAESGAASLIIRTQWLFGIAGPSFPRTMWQRATSGEATQVVDDQTGRPTCTVDLARATWGSLGQPGAVWGNLGRPGAEIVHMANSGTATWYDVAKRVFEAAGRPELLEPCSSAEYPTPARRPAWSVLSTDRYEATASVPLPRGGDAIDRFLRELQEDSSSG
ncbi:MAG: sugar nucleotide-binding protein, partial [Acidimicrobiia bacterium]